jgi:hypothetical protein
VHLGDRVHAALRVLEGVAHFEMFGHLGLHAQEATDHR